MQRNNSAGSGKWKSQKHEEEKKKGKIPIIGADINDKLMDAN